MVQYHILTFHYQHVMNSRESKCHFHLRHISYLLVDICPVVDQQLQTEGTVGGDRSQVQRGEAALVWLINISSMVHQLSSHGLLSRVASHMKRSVSEAIGLINLTAKQKTPEVSVLERQESYKSLNSGTFQQVIKDYQFNYVTVNGQTAMQRNLAKYKKRFMTTLSLHINQIAHLCPHPQ